MKGKKYLSFSSTVKAPFPGLHRKAYMEYQSLAWNIQAPYFGFPQVDKMDYHTSLPAACIWSQLPGQGVLSSG